jgi:ABC-2 type transport system permease protein
MEYRWNFLFRIGCSVLIPLSVRLYLWWAIYQSLGRDTIGEYTREEMMTYQLWLAVIIMFVEVRTTVDNVAEDIRMGRITRYLLFPISMFEINTCQYLGAFIVQGLAGLFGLGVLMLVTDLVPVYFASPNFWVAAMMICLASFLWYVVHYAVGLLAFWLEEIWMFFVLFQIAARFLAGNPIPLDLFPDCYRGISHYLPFEWIFYAPARLLSTEAPSPELWIGVPVLLCWCGVFLVVNRIIWAKGLKMYTAAGI